MVGYFTYLLTPSTRMKSHSQKSWFEDDAYWRTNYPYLFSEEQFARAETIAEKVLDLLQPEGPDMLDLCCGPGRYAIPMAKQGFHVTGIDRTQYLITRGRARARREKVKIRWLKKDMRNFSHPEAFDTVINMWSSFGYCKNREEDREVLQNIHTSLRPGGKVFIDNMGKEVLARINAPTMTEDYPDGKTLVHRVKAVDDWSRVHMDWFLIDGDRVRRFNLQLNLYSGFEMRQMLEQAGFTEIQIHGNFEGDPYDNRARRLITVARKPT